MSSRPARSQEIFESQEAAFVENYDWLIRWALQFTHNDRARAEDLVQEVFAQLAFAYTDLSAVQDVRGYLYTTLKNAHLSAIRLAGRSHGHTQSIVEYSMAAAALGSSDPYSQYQAQDELRRVCQYACARKQSSRAGSALILRYFMGYHVSEAGAVLGATSQAVRQSLRFARNEARLFLDDPAALKFIDADQRVNLELSGAVCPAGELLAQLRLAIFRSCCGECLESESFRDLYRHGQIAAADNCTLAHMVSCPRCLDSANRELGLPLLSERHPADALGPDNTWRGGGGHGGSSGGGLTGNAVRLLRRVRARDKEIPAAFLLQCQRRAREIFEHYPSELRVSANGHVLGSQAVSSETSLLRLDITITEPLSFVEVMSQENARLLVMTVEPPPAGEPFQARHVGLSEGRYLEATLQHGHPWPMLEVVYHDPTFNAETQITGADLDGAWATPRNVVESKSPARLFNFFRDVELFHRPFWSRPGFITGAISLLLIGALLFVHFKLTRPITATRLLARASAEEAMPAGVAELAVHRVINLDERRAGGGLIARNRIEIWRDMSSNASARRVYDATGRLIAGEWIAGDAKAGQKQSRTIYHHGLSPRVEAPVRDLQDIIRELELWRLEPSARDYAELIGQAGGAHVTEDSDTYAITDDGLQPTGEHTISRATLIIRKSDFHAVEEILTLRVANETREYRLVETTFERPPIRAVAPATFVVDPELLSGRVARDAVAAKEGIDLSSRSSASPSIRPSVEASSELEIEVTYLLDRFRTRFGDQLSVTKTSDGALDVQGVVENEEARSEILQALSAVLHNPAVRVEIVTAKEALARLERQRSKPVIAREFTESDSGIPVYAELHRYFSRPGKLQGESSAGSVSSPDDIVDQAVRDFAARVVGHSRRALSHAVELKQLSRRFSATEVATLSPSARATWFTMVRNHAEALRRETSFLSEELQPIFFANRSPLAEGVESPRDADLAAAIAQVHRLVLANDEAIRSDFAASSGASTGQAVKTPRFWASLMTAERLAESVLRLAAKD